MIWYEAAQFAKTPEKLVSGPFKSFDYFKYYVNFPEVNSMLRCVRSTFKHHPKQENNESIAGKHSNNTYASYFTTSWNKPKH